MVSERLLNTYNDKKPIVGGKQRSRQKAVQTVPNTFVSLDEVIASRTVFVIVSESGERAETLAFGAS